MVNAHELKNSLSGSGIEPPEIKIPLANRTNRPLGIDLRLTAERLGEEEEDSPCATENRPPTEAASLTLDSGNKPRNLRNSKAPRYLNSAEKNRREPKLQDV